MTLALILILMGLGARVSPSSNPPTPQAAEINDSNWESHPQIVTIRGIVGSVDFGLKRGAFKVTEKSYSSCPDQHFTLRRIARDSKGVVRWYRDYAEGEDSSWDLNYYYDPAGHLRFVFGVARSANGTREQLRLYFNESAKRIWQSKKRVKGLGCPGCFSAYLDSDEPVAFDPNKEFADDSGCEEIKPKKKR